MIVFDNLDNASLHKLPDITGSGYNITKSMLYERKPELVQK
jgi:hypothetical protein